MPRPSTPKPCTTPASPRLAVEPRRPVSRRPELRSRLLPREGGGAQKIPPFNECLDQTFIDRSNVRLDSAGAEPFQELREGDIGAGLRKRDAAVDHQCVTGDVARPGRREEQ